MEVSGTVTRVTRRRTDYGSTFVSVSVDTGNAQVTTLKYLGAGKPMPTRGQRVTISGVPMIGRNRTNIGGTQVTIHA
jgi:hypothetical protein